MGNEDQDVVEVVEAMDVATNCNSSQAHSPNDEQPKVIITLYGYDCCCFTIINQLSHYFRAICPRGWTRSGISLLKSKGVKRWY